MMNKNKKTFIWPKNIYLFVCLFVDLFVFYFNYLGTPTEIYPKNFVKIPLDLAEILRIIKLDWHGRGKTKEKEKKRRNPTL